MSEESLGSEVVPEEASSRSRRQVLRLAGMAGVAGVAGAAALAAGAGTASAANSPLLLDQDNTITAPTSVTTSGAVVSAAAAFTSTATEGPLAGLAGIGVGSADVKCAGTGRLGQVSPLSGNAEPTWVPNNSLDVNGDPFHELVRTNVGVIWASKGANGASGSRWKRVNAVRVDESSGAGGVFVPIRLLDTRTGAGTPYAANSTHGLTVAGAGSGASAIPADTIAVFGNLTAVATSASGGYPGAGFLTLFPQGATQPLVSNVNPAATGQHAFPNFFFCPLGSGVLNIFTNIATHVIIDIFAYVE
jgi:hypothetical protein